MKPCTESPFLISAKTSGRLSVSLDIQVFEPVLVSSAGHSSVQERKPIMKQFWIHFWRDTQGQDLVEYALAAGMVAVAAVAAMPALSTTVSTVFSKIGSIINSTVN